MRTSGRQGLAFDPRWGLAVLLAVYALLYARALGHEFVWDDFSNVVEDRYYRAPLAEGLRATQHDFLDRTLLRGAQLQVPYESYRPLLTLSYRIDDALFGRAAPAMHAHNLLLGALCILLAWWLCAAVLDSPWAALGATALFALHPLQTEALCYVSARGDLLASVFALAASIAFLASGAAPSRGRRAGWALAAAASFVLSLGAKEAAAGLPLALGLLALALGRGRASLAAAAGLGAALLAYLGLRRALVGAQLSSLDGATTLHALLTLPGFALTYLRAFLVPNDLSIERLPSADWWALPGWLAALAAAFVGGLALRGRLGAWSAPARLACAGLAWFVLGLLPSAVAAETMGVVADRYAHLALLGACLAAAAVAAPLARALAPERAWLPAVAAAAWALTLVSVSALQVSVWRDNWSLYRNSVQVEPESSMAHYRLGVLHAREQRWAEALGYFRTALSLDAGNLRALDNAGVASLRLGRLEQAEQLLARTLEISGDQNFRAWNNLASLRFAQRRPAAGCAALERSLAINPEYEVAQRNHARSCAPAAGAPRG